MSLDEPTNWYHAAALERAARRRTADAEPVHVAFARRFDIDEESGCWPWRMVTDKGYGRFQYRGRLHYAHRFAYELHKGEIPKGLVIDHLCRNRRCVNPDHMEPVTIGENVRRGVVSRQAAQVAS